VLLVPGGKAEPARGLQRVGRPADPFQIEPAELVLGVGVAEIAGRIGEQFAGALRVGLHR